MPENGEKRKGPDWEKIARSAINWTDRLVSHGKELGDDLLVTSAWATVTMLARWFPEKAREFAGQENKGQWLYEHVGGFLEAADEERRQIWGGDKSEAAIVLEKYTRNKNPDKEALRAIDFLRAVAEELPIATDVEDVVSLYGALAGFDIPTQMKMDRWERAVQAFGNIPIASDFYLPLIPTRIVNLAGDGVRVLVRTLVYHRKWETVKTEPGASNPGKS